MPRFTLRSVSLVLGVLLVAGFWVLAGHAVSGFGLGGVSAVNRISEVWAEGINLKTGLFPVKLIRVEPVLPDGVAVTRLYVVDRRSLVGGIREDPGSLPFLRAAELPESGLDVPSFNELQIVPVFRFSQSGAYTLGDVSVVYSVLGLRFRTTVTASGSGVIKVWNPEAGENQPPVGGS
ncbi:MAG: hypothetical protein ACM3WU_07710 [Bacillota bacterium]